MIRRRLMLRLSVVFILCALIMSFHSGFAVSSASAPNAVLEQTEPPNPIEQENQRLGTTAWQSSNFSQYFENNGYNDEVDTLLPSPTPIQRRLGMPSALAATSVWSDPEPISGYPSVDSINIGEAISFHISSRLPLYDLDIYRMGWYNGSGGRLIRTVRNLVGVDYGVPTPDPNTGLIEASWPVAYTLQTDATYTTGYYMATLRPAGVTSSSINYIPFVIRDDSSHADILYQVAFTTYQAYNAWGGKSLYPYNSGNVPATHVSFDRPYDHDDGSGLFFSGDYNMIRWMESQGYSIAYATNLDLERDPSLLNNHKVFLSNFHDEYWSWNMRQNITAARDNGVDLAFFDSNNVYFQIRFQPSSSGVANRIVVCYKNATNDPMSTSSTPWLTTVRWRDAPVNRPENELLGVMLQEAMGFGEHFPYVVSNASHWIYEGTGLQNGDTIPLLVGYEYDRVFSNGVSPIGLEVVSHSPAPDPYSGYSNATFYTAPSGAMIFSASTNYWAYMLDGNWIWQRDARVQRMTQNILNRMIDFSGPLGTPTPTLTVTPGSPVPVTPSLTPTASNTFTPSPTRTPTGTPTFTPTRTPLPSTAQSGLTGDYFNGSNFETLVLSRTDSSINFNWGSGSPAAGVPVDGFSVRWTGYIIPLYTETYVIYPRTGDGVRLWLNGTRVVNAWWSQDVTERSVNIPLTAGQPVPIVMEFFEKWYTAEAYLSWSSASQAKEIIPASQLLTVGGSTPTPIPSLSPTATPTLITSPTNTLAPSATFTPSNTPTASATSSLPTFTPSNTPTATVLPPTATPSNTPTATSVPPTATPTNTATATSLPPTFTPSNTPTATALTRLPPPRISAATATATSYAITPPTSRPRYAHGAPPFFLTIGGLRGDYFNGGNFETFVLSRTDSSINFNWGSGSPAAGVTVDAFSVRWTGYIIPRYTETYVIYPRTGDGVRLWLNGTRVVNAWWSQDVTERSVSIALTAGQPVPIVMEFFEKWYTAEAYLSWSSPSQLKEVIPASQLAVAEGSAPTPIAPTATPTHTLTPTATSVVPTFTPSNTPTATSVAANGHTHEYANAHRDLGCADVHALEHADCYISAANFHAHEHVDCYISAANGHTIEHTHSHRDLGCANSHAHEHGDRYIVAANGHTIEHTHRHHRTDECVWTDHGRLARRLLQREQL